MPQLIYRATQLKLNKVNSNQTADYDMAAVSYDDYYSKYLGKSAISLWEKLPIKRGQLIADLACGTGFFTEKIAREVGSAGNIIAVDLSQGMLQQNQQKALAENLTNIDFVQNDALDFLATIADDYFDGVVCGWGICYMDHRLLVKELARVIKPGGFIGLIENKSRSLKDVADLFTKVLLDYPEAMEKNTNLYLPKDKNYLAKTFGGREFQMQSAWDGEIIIPCKDGKDVAEYMLKSGASAGFLDSLNKKMTAQVFQTFIRYADERFGSGIGVLVKHEYCAVVSIKI